MANDKHETIEQQAAPNRERELSEAELEQVVGGLATTQATLSDTAKPVPPRDSVSGNATGRRAYRPVEFSA